MTGIPNMIRWNANFVRGLAQSVLDRARVIRSSLNPKPEERRKSAARKAVKKTVRRARSPRRSNA